MAPPSKELQAIEMTRTDVPNLREHEEAWALGTGETVGVRIRRAGRTEHSVSFWVDARLLEDDGSTKPVAGEPCECPRGSHTIALDALTSGATTVAVELDYLRRRACWRARNHKAILLALEAVPAAPRES